LGGPFAFRDPGEYLLHAGFDGRRSRWPFIGASLAEVDLQLLTRARLEAHRRPRFGAQLLAQMRHSPLDRAQAHLDALLGCKLLTNHIGIARVAAEPLFQPNLQAIQRFQARRGWWPVPSSFLQPTPRRRPRASELRRDPARSPAERLQLEHRRYIVRLLHLVPPQTLGPRKPLN
jgi:hypothetical protein